MNNKLFNKVVGIVLSSSIILTGIISSPPAFAEDRVNDGQEQAQNENNSEEANYAEIESTQIKDQDNNSAIVQIDLDKSIENTDMPIFVYKNDNPKSFKEISKGGSKIKLEIEKEEKEQYLNFTTGDSSQDIIINPQVEEVGNFEIIADKTILKNTGKRPIISWGDDESYEQYSDFNIFAVDGNGKIVHKNEFTFDGSFTIPYFYKELEMSYTVYIADNDKTITSLDDLTQIKAISNSITIKKMDWNIELSNNTEEYTTDSDVEISWTSNEITNNYYSAYLIYRNTGKIYEELDFTSKTGKSTIRTYDISDEDNEFLIYISKKNNTAQNLSDLSEIQANSNVISTKQKPFELNVHVSQKSLHTYDNKIFFNVKTNQNVGINTKYELYFFDLDEPDPYYEWDDNGDGINTTINGSIMETNYNYSSGKKRFQFVIAERKDNFENMSELKILKKSDIIEIDQIPFDGTASVVPGKIKNKIVWKLNQPLKSWYFISLINKDNGRIVYQTQEYKDDSNEGEIEEIYNEHMSSNPDWFKGNYKIVISEDNYNSEFYNELTNIQKEIDVQNNLSNPKWYVSLNYNSISEGENKYNFYVSTNLTNYEDTLTTYIVKDSNGEIIYKYFGNENNFNFNRNIGDNQSESYTAYVADLNDSATNYSQLTNIIANSNSVYPKFIPSTKEYNPKGGRFSGGFNPSSTDCQQQCYGDPINNYTGEYFENSNDLIVDSNSPLSLTRSYSTFNKNKLGIFGLGTTNNYNMSLIGEFDNIEDSDNLRIIQENGSIINFIKNKNNQFVSSIDTGSELKQIDNTYVMSRKTGEKFVFNNDGKLIKILNLFNKESVLTYTDNKLTKINADDGKYISIQYNTNNLIKKVTDGTRDISYIYDSNKRLIEVQSYEFNSSKKYTYDSSNRVSEIIQPNGGIYENFYNNEDKVIKQINPLNGETLFEYNEDYEEYSTSITLPDGSVKVDNYDFYGRLISETFDENEENKTYYYEYTPSGQVASTEDPQGNIIEYSYDENGNITYITDELNRITRYTYNELNQVVEKINPLGEKFINTYNDEGMLKSTKDENGNVTKYETTEDGKLSKITNPEELDKDNPKFEKISYDSNGYISQQVSPEGEMQKIENNSIGLPIKLTDPLNNNTKIEYNDNFDMSKKLYPNGTFEKYDYDNSGKLNKYVDTLGNVTEYNYDKMDNLVSLTTSHGTTAYEYDSGQRLIKKIEPNGGINNYIYDNLGRLIEAKNPAGKSTKTEYDDAGNIISQTDFNNFKTEYSYDEVGNLIEVIDANNNSVYYTYDDLNRLTEEEQKNGYLEEYKYDNVGNLLNVNKNYVDTTEYKYNKNNKIINVKYSDDSEEVKKYNSNGSLISFTNRDEKITKYFYNENNQLKETIRPDSSKESIKYNSMGDTTQISYDSWATVDKEYKYNDLGQLSKITKDNDEINYAYDSIGQLTSRGPPSKQINYTYDNHGNLNGIEYPSGKKVDYEYDILNQIDKVVSENETIVDYEYDNNGNTIKELYGNDVERNSTYDKLNRLKNINITKESSSLYSRNLTYDKTYLIKNTATSVNNDSTKNQKINYSDLNKISQINNTTLGTKEQYNLDNYSNIIKSPSSQNTISENGQLLTSRISGKNYSYEYDDKGNRLSKSNGNNKFNDKYTWSDDNKLENIKITTKDNPTINIDYEYDVSGLLKSRSKDSSKTDDYVWDELSSIPLLLEDNTNNYIYGNDNSPIAQIDKNSGDISYLHRDERNSVILATDSEGNSLLTRDYDAYGNQVDETIINPPNAPPVNFETNFGYAGEYLDEDTGLYNLRARWYEPLTGSFISEDPLLTITGEAYSYASGNPLSFVDPLGLSSTGNSSTAGNIAAGFVDGLIGFPVVEKISNYISPGSVDTCSDAYKYSGYAGFAAGFIIPGGAFVKGGVLAGKIGAKTFSSISKKFSQRNESGFVLINFSKKDFDRSKISDLQEISKITKKTTNQMNREIRKGQAPKGITRVDNPNAENSNMELPHITFDNGVGWNINGTFKDEFRSPNFYPNNKQLKWGEKFGFIRP